MATIVTRTGKGSALTQAEVDDNFTNLNNELGLKTVSSTLASSAGASLVGFLGSSDGFSSSETNVDLALKFLSNNHKILNISSISQLRTNNKSKSIAFVSGYYSEGDGGQGYYYKDSSDSTSADNSVSVIVDALGGRWKPILTNGQINARRCGMKPQAGFDNSPLLQTAVNSYDIVIFDKSSSSYEFNTRITLGAGKRLIGNGAKLKKTNGDYLFEITGSKTLLDGFEFTANSTSTATGFCTQRTDLSAIEYTYIQNITTYYSGAFLIDVVGANFATNTHLTNISCRLHRGYGIYLTKNFAYLHLTNVNIDYVGSNVRTSQAFTFVGNEGAFLYACDVTGGTVDATNPNQHGFVLQNCKAMWFTNCMADTVGGKGFYGVTGNQYIYVTNCVSSLCGQEGMYFNVTNDLIITSSFIGGRVGLGYAPASKNGLYIDVSNNVQISNVKSSKNTGNGIHLANSKCTISGGRSENNSGWGLDSTGIGGNTVSLTTGVVFLGNTSGNVRQTDTYQHLTACQINSGMLASLSGAGSI